jgi:hypothetical protein
MVFPSLFFQIENSGVTQFSAWVILAFSYFLFRFRKIFIASVFIILSFFAYNKLCSAAIGVGSYYSTSCFNNPYCYSNLNYYQTPYRNVPPVYFFPQLPFQAISPSDNYFLPHAPSPYDPAYCPACNLYQMQNQFQSQPTFSIHPGGGIS